MNTMALEPKKKRFWEPEAVETSIENIKKAIPRSTLYTKYLVLNVKTS